MATEKTKNSPRWDVIAVISIVVVLITTVGSSMYIAGSVASNVDTNTVVLEKIDCKIDKKMEKVGESIGGIQTEVMDINLALIAIQTKLGIDPIPKSRPSSELFLAGETCRKIDVAVK